VKAKIKFSCHVDFINSSGEMEETFTKSTKIQHMYVYNQKPKKKDME
jgi:hypothetical protein